MNALVKTLKKIGIVPTLYKLAGRLFPNDKYILSCCDRIGAYRYLQKYKYVLVNLHEQNKYSSDNQPKSSIIWLCWLQGYDNAPVLVQKCRDSVYKHNPNMDIIVVDNSNLENYVQLPDYIIQKHEKGIIPHAHFTDLIRISLLEKYGGTWIDATAYATDRLPDYIINSELFCFKAVHIGKGIASNWFISARQNHPIICQLKSLLFEYWKKENRLVSYSIFHLFLDMTISFNETNNSLWEHVPYFDDINCKVLQMELFDSFSQERFDQIKTMTPIHKLTYKFDQQQGLLENTFYKFLTE